MHREVNLTKRVQTSAGMRYCGGKRVACDVAAIFDAVRWAEEIMKVIDDRWPEKNLG